AAWLGAMLDTATVALIYKLARRCGAPKPAALGGALLYAAYPLAITYSALNMPNTFNAFCLLVLANIFHGFTRSTPLWKWAATGLFIGVVCLSFAGMLLVTIVVASSFALTFIVGGLRAPRAGGVARSATPTALAKILAMLVAAALPIIPISLHNY